MTYVPAAPRTGHPGRRHRPLHLVFSLGLLIGPLMTHAIPVADQPLGGTFPAPAGFEAIPVTNVTPDSIGGQFFVMRGSNEAPSWFSIRRLPGDHPESNDLAWSSDSDELRVVNRYSERLGGLDLDILEAELVTNDITFRQRSIQFSMASERFLLDLRSPSLKTNEMDEIMKQVAKTIAIQNATVPREEVQGWRNAIVCLAMVAMIVVVAIARR